MIVPDRVGRDMAQHLGKLLYLAVRHMMFQLYSGVSRIRIVSITQRDVDIRLLREQEVPRILCLPTDIHAGGNRQPEGHGLSLDRSRLERPLPGGIGFTIYRNLVAVTRIRQQSRHG